MRSDGTCNLFHCTGAPAMRFSVNTPAPAHRLLATMTARSRLPVGFKPQAIPEATKPGGITELSTTLPLSPESAFSASERQRRHEDDWPRHAPWARARVRSAQRLVLGR